MLEFSPMAREDLFEIAAYIGLDNPARASSFVDELETKCLALERAPGIGTTRPELGDGLRMLPHGRYLIFYRANLGDVRIERVLHGARDIGTDAFEP